MLFSIRHQTATIVTILCTALLQLVVPAETIARTPEDYLRRAIQAANWLDSVAIKNENGLTWPTVPSLSPKSNDALYSGNSGVVLFYLYLHRATNEQHYLDQAIAGADALVHQVGQLDENAAPGLMTGVSGIAYTLSLMHQQTKLKRFSDAEHVCFEHVKSTAKPLKLSMRPSVNWNDVTDIISGSAGIGFYLLDRFQRTENAEALRLAMQVGDGLLHVAIQVKKGQRKWMMTPTYAREMPNYSHGTAGVCDYLVVLDTVCKKHELEYGKKNYDNRYLESAIQGARYLDAIAGSNTQNLLPHHLPADGTLNYLGWCHGPTGTVVFMERLAHATKDLHWSALSAQLVSRMLACGIPETRTDGFWNNVGVCCGNAGVASFFLDRFAVNKQEKDMSAALRMAQDIIQRGTMVKLPNGKTGIYWTQAEHRTRPELLQAQTGMMQGAAGIGLFFLKMDAAQKGHPLKFRLPMMPF